MALNTFRVGVLMGGRSAERAISLKSGEAIYRALRRLGYSVARIDVDETLPWKLRSNRVDVAFLALHGPGGEDGTVQGLLEVLRIPYTGSGVRASAVAMDKPMTKDLLATQGIPIPRGIVLEKPARHFSLPTWLTWPLVVKPAAQGSTVGVTIVRSSSEWNQALHKAFQQDHHVVVETYIAGREMAVGVLDDKVFPSVEILAPEGFYDYAAKYEKSGTCYVCPALLTQKQEARLRDFSTRAYALLGCAGAARVDFRLNRQGRPFVLEVNTIPGMTERSLLPMAAAQAGLDYEALTEQMLCSALNQAGWSSRMFSKQKGAKGKT
ncbi:MAG: D-alanine--D-alanine ligase [Nitrospirales bacterium]|nr:D-alanine--D-alanine ligase [Nitrospirales bacterium]